MPGKLVHVEINAANADRAQGFWSGVFGWEIGPPMSPEMDYRMFRTGEDQGGAIVGGQAQGPSPSTSTPRTSTRPSARCASSAARPRTRCRCRATAGSPAARTPRGTRSASGRATSLRRSRGVRLRPDDHGRIELAEHIPRRQRPAVDLVRFVLLVHPVVERATARSGYVPRRSRTRSAFPSLRGIVPGSTISTCAVSPSTL
jgi:catechol 2,3-dioxygenase-like lactoylglutathione lyase family enzyme